ncbi:translocation protein SEC63 homolog isoform X2 [Aplysia californica]|uniref:Translocation protein SEC63 homolog isoform X2 n=1 Tax=Aplysia californica TaxID=6500 RepID=A0ABM0JPI1_APLCA|nr:translocation protein SEC63 homolog isoform X2 [Aplysia californica]
MAGMQFEYDEEGGTFFYFLISFWALILIPSTYFLWPSTEKKDDEEKKRRCLCQKCITKRENIAKEKASIKPTVIKIGLAVGWVIFILLAWKVSMIQLDYVEYDPFNELGIDRGASAAEIKRAYRKLSLIYHPDRETGDPKKFMRIAKAYAALTDEESRKNWEEHGNPDGPEALRVGIALPKWIVERENSMWVLALYGVVFMIVLPVVVGIWWYRSIKFSGDQVLLDTTRLYYYFINKTSNMILKRAVMILAASCEFDRMHNAEVIERPTDNEELPLLIKQLQNVQEKNKERPLCFAYSVKARTLLLAHFQRVPLNPNTLQIDQDYILKKCPYLINDMVNICASLVAMAMSGRVSQPPRLDSIENIMKMSQMVIQALDEKASPLQQLPHITPDMLRHFTTRKRDIRHIRDFVNMNHDDRRNMLRTLSDQEYKDVMTVCSQLPYLEMKVRTEVLDEEDTTITAGSIVTVTVSLVRKDMGDMFEQDMILTDEETAVEEAAGEVDGENEEENEDEEAVEEGNQGEVANAADSKSKSWDKNKGKGKKKGGKVKKKTKQVYQWKAAAQAKVESATAAAAAAKTSTETDSPKPTKSSKAEKKEGQTEEDGEDASEEEENNATEEEEETTQETSSSAAKPAKAKKSTDDDDDDEDWDNYKMESKKENSLDTKKKESHLVHCPYFPGEKQEGWWVYVADRKHHLLITAPVHVCSLKTDEEVQLKFSAPDKPGHFQFTVVLRSDSYYGDFDQSQTIKLDVKEAKVIEDHPQWDISEDEDEKDKDNEDETEDDDSDYSSEDDGSE